jgi:hypothetical protein
MKALMAPAEGLLRRVGLGEVVADMVPPWNVGRAL